MALNPKMVEEIRKAVGDDNFSSEDYIVQTYAKSYVPFMPRIAPAAVVLPGSADEVSEILKIANRYKAPVIPRGIGTDLTGGSMPLKEGSIVLDIHKRMNKILNIDFATNIVTVEAGAQIGELQAALNAQGYWLGINGPANGSATMGGIVSNVSQGGGGEVMYGGPGGAVVSMEVVLPTGQIIETGPNAFKKGIAFSGGRNVGGPDLAGMFIGDPGILGIKTKITFKIYVMPQFFGLRAYLVPGKAQEGAKAVDPLLDTKLAMTIFEDLERIGMPGINGGGYFNATVFNMWADNEWYEPWTRIREPGKLNQNGALALAVCGNSQEEVDRNLEQIDAVLEKHDCAIFGDAIEDGNFCTWMAVCGGGWSAGQWWYAAVADLAWTGVEPCFTAIRDLYQRRLIDFQDAEHRLPGLMLSPIGGGLKVVVGFIVPEDVDQSEAKRKMMKDIHDEAIKVMLENGATLCWTGPLYANLMVEENSYQDSYLGFLKAIKDALDPNGILSPGTFHFND